MRENMNQETRATKFEYDECDPGNHKGYKGGQIMISLVWFGFMTNRCKYFQRHSKKKKYYKVKSFSIFLGYICRDVLK